MDHTLQPNGKTLTVTIDIPKLQLSKLEGLEVTAGNNPPTGVKGIIALSWVIAVGNGTLGLVKADALAYGSLNGMLFICALLIWMMCNAQERLKRKDSS